MDSGARITENPGLTFTRPAGRTAVTADLKILLVSPDLMATSRIAGLCREAGASLETLRHLGDLPHGGPFDVVLLDLQAMVEDPAVIVTRARTAVATRNQAEGRAATIVAFGPHVAKERLALARDAGADDVVSRGELLGGFAGLLRRWRPGD
jgi:CheY-like chemotaxis protein